MTQQTASHNPFMLLLQPEVVIAAMERSEHLNQLNRHQCRPLDRLVAPAGAQSGSTNDVENDSLSDDDLQQ